ncbi:MAG: hypothetical protein ABIO49_00700 [Dokdonella sp.]
MKKIRVLVPALLSSITVSAFAAAHAGEAHTMPSIDTVKHLQDYQVIEFRRYVTTDGERTHFAKYFDAYFPEAFEQLGVMVFGQFLDRDQPNHFTWVRGSKDISARPIANAAFYYGPVWKEHKLKVNAILPDSDNVMLLRPLHAEHGVSVLPAVDPVIEEGGATGVVVAQIFAVKKGSEEAFAQKAEAAFAHYRVAGVHEAGVLVTLDVPNNFPQLPIRTDGPWLIWLGVAKDTATLESSLAAQMKRVEQSLGDTGLLRGATERLVMDPTPRSRLRWFVDAAAGTPSP